jgi:spermidine/putrescine transport system permease protein
MSTTSLGASAGPRPNRRLRAPRFLLAIPSFVWYGFFYALPVLLMILNSFGYKPRVGEKGYVRLDKLSFDNYRNVWTQDFRGVFFSTMRIAGTATLLCIVVGLPIAYYIAIKAGPKMKGVMLLMVIVPFWMSFFVRTSAWKIVLAKNGLVNDHIVSWGLRSSPIDVIGTRAAVLLALVYNYLPLMVLPMFVSLDRIEPAMREASKDLGAGRIKTFLSVTAPLAAPGITAGAVLTFIPMAGDYVTATILGGAKGNMIGATIYNFAIQGQDVPKGAAAAAILILLILSAVAIAGLAIAIGRGILKAMRRVDVPGAA